MRFRPNRYASTDHAPGPIIARAAPKDASTICIDELLKWNERRDNSAMAISEPTMGVQRPTIKSVEQPAASNCKAIENGGVGANGPAMSCTSGIAVTARRNTNPVPGQPSGNVEKSLCTRGPAFRLQIGERSRNPLSRCLEVDNAALQPDRNGVCPIVRIEFGEDVFDVTLHSLFRDGELSGDLFVGVAT